MAMHRLAMPDSRESLGASTTARIAELETLLERQRDRALLERDQLRESHRRLQLELALLKRRIFVAKAERVNTAQLELEFAAKRAELDQLTKALQGDAAEPAAEAEADSQPDEGATAGGGDEEPASPKKPPKCYRAHR